MITTKSQTALKNEFFQYLNHNCKLDESAENTLSHLTMQTSNIFKSKEQKLSDPQPQSSNPQIQPQNSGIVPSSKALNLITNSYNQIEKTKSSLLLLNNEIDTSFAKLSSILESRDSLQNILKDFNQNTKIIMNQKDKMGKLISSIDSIYKIYEQTLSIQSFLDNNACVLKYRFYTDYDEIEKGINFFTLNTNYTESSKYLNLYIILKVACVNKYYIYISDNLNKEESAVVNAEKDILFSELLNCIDEEKKGYYNLYKNYEKMRELISFFETKSKYDNEVKQSQDKLKQKYIEIRISKINKLYNNLFESINNLYEQEKKPFSDINNYLNEISRNVFLEIVHYGILFGHNYENDVYMLRSITNIIFTSLYNNIRPIIVNLVSLEDLINLFDAFSNNFGILFLELDKDEINKNKNDIENNQNNKESVDSNSIHSDNNDYANTSNTEKIINFFSAKFPAISQIISKKENLQIFIDYLVISRHLIRPKIQQLIQDIQEKIYFKINYHVKNNFIEIESDFSSFGVFEEKLYSKYNHFSLFHFFLKRIVIIYEIFKLKLDDSILNQIIVSSIETFISILNKEILDKKNLHYEFQIYVIQQLLLCMEIVDKFQIETVSQEIDINFNFITDMFNANYEALITGRFSVSEVLANSAPKILDRTKDFKKILYNNLLKNYKIFINLSNEFIFGRELVDLYTKIVNKKEDKNLYKLFIEKFETFNNIFIGVQGKKDIVLDKFKGQIQIVDDKVNIKIEKVLKENIIRVIRTFKNYFCLYKEEENKETFNEYNKSLDGYFKSQSAVNLIVNSSINDGEGEIKKVDSKCKSSMDVVGEKKEEGKVDSTNTDKSDNNKDIKILDDKI